MRAIKRQESPTNKLTMNEGSLSSVRSQKGHRWPTKIGERFSLILVVWPEQEIIICFTLKADNVRNKWRK
jgi:hypothetical protein